MHGESYATEFIENARHFERCDWCGRDGSKNRKGLCRHCNEVRKDLEHIQKRIPQPRTFTEKWYLRLAQEKKESCVAWGKMVRNILDGSVAPLQLEHWFCQVARRVGAGEKKIR